MSLIVMDDPSVSNQSRPIYKEETAHFGVMNLNEYNFNFGVYLTNHNDTHIHIPAGVGRIISEQYKDDKPIEGT